VVNPTDQSLQGNASDRGAEEEVPVPELIPNLDALSFEELYQIPGLRQLEHLEAALPTIVEKMRASGAAPTGRKQLRMFRPAEAAQLLGRSESFVRRAADELGINLAKDPRHPTWRLFSVEDILTIRRQKQIAPYRPPGRPPQIIAFANQKGGAAKTSSAVNFAHDLATRGYRVLAVDLDPQQSLTSTFEVELDGELLPCTSFEPSYAETIGPVVVGDAPLIQSLIRGTHWPNIDLIPAGAELVEAEMELVVKFSQGTGANAAFFRYLRDSLRELATDTYDVVVLDTPPSMSLTTVEVGAAADGIVIPCPPRAYDVSSLLSFVRIMRAWLGTVDPDMSSLRWVRVLPTMVHRNSKSERIASALMELMNRKLMLGEGVPFLEAIKRGSSATPSVFEAPPSAPRSLAAMAAQARRELEPNHEAILKLIGHAWTLEATP
jgi:chromosome partitioning protein